LVEAGAALTGTTVAGTLVAGAATGIVFAGVVRGAAAVAEAAWVALVVDCAGFAATATEFVSAGDRACGWSSSDIFCFKAARAAAWSGVSSALTERQLATKAAHKTTRILAFMK
jgi:hypothetical protein